MSVCLLCGSDAASRILEGPNGLPYRRCGSCGYVFMEPDRRMDASREKARYELHENSPEDAGYAAWLRRFLDFALFYPPRDHGPVLDFGSGPVPVMARMMEDLGYSVSTEDAYFAPGRRPGPFRLITAVEVFEHLTDPAGVMADLAARLLPGGRLCVSTEFLPADSRDFPSWHYRSDPTHVGFFTPQALNGAAISAGLEPLHCDGVRYASYRLPCPSGPPMIG